ELCSLDVVRVTVRAPRAGLPARLEFDEPRAARAAVGRGALHHYARAQRSRTSRTALRAVPSDSRRARLRVFRGTDQRGADSLDVRAAHVARAAGVRPA